MNPEYKVVHVDDNVVIGCSGENYFITYLKENNRTEQKTRTDALQKTEDCTQ